MNTRRNLFLALVALGTVLPLSPATSAELDPGVRTSPVSLTGIDLANPAGAETVYRRLNLAAQSVCRPLHTLELGKRRAKWDRCVTDAVARAVADINAPALTAYAKSKGGKKPAMVVAREP